jgi:two-component system cell cycle sensor histidine kinase/response regulator CckA
MTSEDRRKSTHGRALELEAARLQLARLRVGPTATLRQIWLSLADIAATTLQVERIGVWVLVDGDRALRCRYLLQRSSHDVFEGAMLRQQDFPQYFQALHSHRTLAAANAPTSSLTSELFEQYLEPLGITSMLDAPIYVQGHVVGVVCHEHTGTPRHWSEADANFASCVADNIARLYQEHEQHHARSALLSYERQLMELHRMEAVGRIAAEVAHDFRGILNAAMGFAELIRRSPDISADVDRYANKIVDAMQRGGQLTQEVMSFGKDSPVAPRVVDVRTVVNTMASMFKVLLGERIELQSECEQAVSRSFIDVSQLERALLNLILNARDALPSGGIVRIAVAEASLDSDEDDSARFVTVSVIDNGVGMDADTCRNVLKPFFTTKGDAGTGLGLAIVDQIITRAGGNVRIDSELGKGTTVCLYLPRIAGALAG